MLIASFHTLSLQEQEYMFKRGVPVTRDTFLQPDRRVPYWVQWFTYFCRSFF